MAKNIYWKLQISISNKYQEEKITKIVDPSSSSSNKSRGKHLSQTYSNYFNWIETFAPTQRILNIKTKSPVISLS